MERQQRIFKVYSPTVWCSYLLFSSSLPECSATLSFNICRKHQQQFRVACLNESFSFCVLTWRFISRSISGSVLELVYWISLREYSPDNGNLSIYCSFHARKPFKSTTAPGRHQCHGHIWQMRLPCVCACPCEYFWVAIRPDEAFRGRF